MKMRIKYASNLQKEYLMSVRLNLVLSDDLDREISRVADDAESSKSEVLRKALQLYLEATNAAKRGLQVGLVNPTTNVVETKIIGL